MRFITFLAFVAGLCFANPAVVPEDRLKEPWWAERHQQILEEIKKNPGAPLLLIGDSITNNYDKANPPDEDFQPTWKQFYAPRQALNLGFSGDTTAHVLWRLNHGEVDGLRPKVALVLIGTNNTGAGQSAEETETGIDAVVANLERRLPETHILLLGILPSAVSGDKTRRDKAVNHYLAQCYGEHPRVTYLDIGGIFYHDGELKTGIFYDPRLTPYRKPLHPDTKGQHMMAEAIEPTLAKLMGDEPRVALSEMTDINTALIPVPRLEQDSYDWYARHHAEMTLLERGRTADLVFIGDSITHFWGGLPRAAQVNGPNAWQRIVDAVPQWTIVNMGFGWDRTQNVLWRIQQGELDAVPPHMIVLNIGTNNLVGTAHARANTPEEIVEGIGAICREIRERYPDAHIVLMGIFPRGNTAESPLRAVIQRTNELLNKRFWGGEISFLDIGKQFLDADGTLPETMMPDATHPSDAGYKIWADALIKAGIQPMVR